MNATESKAGDLQANSNSTSRRGLLKGAVAGMAAAGLASLLLPPPRAARAAGLFPATAPADEPASPAFYRFRVGAIEATVLSDGVLTFTPPQPTVAPDASPGELDAALRRHFLPTDRYLFPCNVLALRWDGNVVLIDTGSGDLLGPDVGKLPSNLAAAGINAADVTAVVLTHAHPDHIGGAVDAPSGKPAFPNATYFAPRAEVDFWTGPNPDFGAARMPAETRAKLIRQAQERLAAIGGVLRRVGPGDRIVDGLQYFAAPGHTPGHSGLLIASGGEQLLHVGDAIPEAYLGFARPEWGTIFDVAPRQAIDTRRAILARAADERTRIFGYHFGFPGIGHVRRGEGDGGGGEAYAYVAEPWSW